LMEATMSVKNSASTGCPGLMFGNLLIGSIIAY
jgi:hypothetical protein